MGKEPLYVWEKTEGVLHEEAAERLRAICQNANMSPTPVKEGKIELIADIDGLFRVDVARLNAINALDEVMTPPATTTVRRGTSWPEPGSSPGGGRAGSRRPRPPPERRPCWSPPPPEDRRHRHHRQRGLLGRIEDAFTPVLIQKLAAFGGKRSPRSRSLDERGKIVAAVSCRPGSRRGADSLHGRHERGP